MLLVSAVGRTMARTSAPPPTSCRVTWEPRNPFAPITSFGVPVISLLHHRAVALHPLCRVVGQRPELLRLLAPFQSGPDEPHGVVDVLFPAPQAAAGIGHDRDVRRRDDGAV